MKVILYNNNAERSKVDKTLLLSNPIEYNGTLRSECSITKPVIEVQTSGLITSNYAFIEEFNRYYFIDEVVSIRNNLWRVSMTVDVLMSFKTEILNQKAFVIRTGELSLNGNVVDLNSYGLPDPEFPFDSKFNTFETRYGLTNFELGENIVYYIIVSKVPIYDQIALDGDEIPFSKPNPNLSPLIGTNVYYFTDLRIFSAVCYTLFNNNEVNNYIISVGSILISPNFSTFTRVLNKASLGQNNVIFDFEIGNKVIDIVSNIRGYATNATVGYLANENSVMKYSTSINIGFYFDVSETANSTKYVNKNIIFDENSKVCLYLPFYGEYEMPKSSCYKYIGGINMCGFIVGIAMDFTTCTLTYNIYTIPDSVFREDLYKNKDLFIDSVSVKVNSEFPITKSDLNVVKANDTANSIRGLTNIFTGFGSGVINAVAGNYTGAANDALGIISAGANTIANSVTNLQHSSHVFNGDSNFAKLSTVKELYIVYYYRDISPNITYEEYLKLNGTTVNAITELSNCKYHTKVSVVHLENIPRALSEEIDQIERELKRGVIF